MILFGIITFLASIALIRLLSPLSNSIVAHFNHGESVYTGVITNASYVDDSIPVADRQEIQRSVETSHARYALYDGHALYVLSGQQIPQDLVAHKVRVRGTLHKNARVLDVKAIDPA
jgi:hypothetical protein